MSKKTRSQKIIAELRRKVKLSQLTSSPSINPVNIQYSFVNKNEKLKPPEEIIKVDNLLLIKKDLSKTLFFSLLVTGIILVLYWSLEVQKIL